MRKLATRARQRDGVVASVEVVVSVMDMPFVPGRRKLWDGRKVLELAQMLDGDCEVSSVYSPTYLRLDGHHLHILEPSRPSAHQWLSDYDAGSAWQVASDA